MFYSGPTAKSSFLLIAIYPILGINLVLALSATWVFLS
ncbi:protein of unknown function [Nitrospira japonica]|uniref:Uncharacterized protein n=1 Tax=Nitrospira japonica TaxID=1325564 RepID=A0A1W1IAF2_9BACT|nr:protein of unknown function [Nitrospira japonica]